MEPVGFAYGRNAIGGVVIGFDVDVLLSRPGGRKVIEAKNALSVVRSSRHENREIFFDFEIDLGNLPSGEYSVKLTLNDRHSDETAEVLLDFSIVE